MGESVLSAIRAPRLVYLRSLGVVAWLVASLALGVFGGVALAAAFLLIVTLVSVAFAVRRRAAIADKLPVASGLLLLFIVYTRISDVGVAQHGLPSVTQPLVLVLALATVIRRTRAGAAWGLHAHRGLWAAMGLYTAVIFASSIWATDGSAAFSQGVELAKNLLIVYIIVETFDSPRTLRLAVWCLIASGMLISGLTVFQALTHTYGNSYGGLAQAPLREITIGSAGERSSGPVGDPNFYGLILAALVPLALTRARDEANYILKCVALTAAVLLIAGLMLTYSRGDTIALALVLLLYIPLARVKRSHVVVALVLIVPLAVQAPSSFWDRIASLSTVVASSASSRTDASIQDRAGATEVALAMFEDHPLTGVGADNYGTTYFPYALRLNVPSAASRSHDLYLQVASETGLPGLVTFAAILMLALGALWRRRAIALAAGDQIVDGLAISSLLSLGAYLIGSVFLPSAYPRYLWVLIGIGMAVALAGGADEKAAPDPAAAIIGEPAR